MDLLDAGLSEVVPPHWMREKVMVRNARGREIPVPRCCPIPPHLIESTWCDWADGWYIYLVKGLPISTVREASGELEENHRHSDGWLNSLECGWHATDGEKTVISSTELEHREHEWPTSDRLYELWAAILDDYDEVATASRVVVVDVHVRTKPQGRGRGLAAWLRSLLPRNPGLRLP